MRRNIGPFITPEKCYTAARHDDYHEMAKVRLSHVIVMKWLQLGNARNMLMTVNIKLSIIVIAEIIPSTDDTCLHQSISPQNGPMKVPNSTPANHQRESIASILPVVSTIIATVCRTRRHNY